MQAMTLDTRHLLSLAAENAALTRRAFSSKSIAAPNLRSVPPAPNASADAESYIDKATEQRRQQLQCNPQQTWQAVAISKEYKAVAASVAANASAPARKTTSASTASNSGAQASNSQSVVVQDEDDEKTSQQDDVIRVQSSQQQNAQALAQSNQGALITQSQQQSGGKSAADAVVPYYALSSRTQALIRSREQFDVQPTWHAPWKLSRVIAGHSGWVRSIACDVSNEWFVTGSADRTIKCWDLASGHLKLTLTGHISAVRGLAVSKRHPYLFSAGEDKTVKCWDLEHNKVIRSYHGHLSGVYCLSIHPSLDVLMSGGRDSTCRVWDIRTKAQVAVLAGHTSTVAAIESQTTDPQVITCSHDSTVKLWDLATQKIMTTLTHHKKSVRAAAMHPTQYSFATASADATKIWRLPQGQLMRNAERDGHESVVNALCCNHDGVLVSGADNGSLSFVDYSSGHQFDRLDSITQPGSLDSEAGIFAATFDYSGSRLITAEADKSIKIFKEDAEATPESHPIRKVKKRRHF